MISWRNPLLFAICLLLAGNLVFNRPARSGMPHGRRAQNRATATTPWMAASDDDVATGDGDVAMGQVVYASNCTSCHGSRGHGMPRQGANLRTSRFVAERSDEQLLAFLRQGRAAGDPASVMGQMMPARGGNRALDDAAMSDVVAFLRAMQEEERQERLAATAAATDDDAATTRPSLAGAER